MYDPDPCATAGHLDAEPSAEERALVARLVAAETAALNAPEPVEPWAHTAELGRRARTAEVLTRRSQAAMLREVHALTARVVADDAAYFKGVRDEALEFAGDEIAAALGISHRSAEIRIEDAFALVESCPRTLACLEAGIVAYPVAAALAREAARAPVGLRAEVESRVLDAVGSGEIDQLGRLPVAQFSQLALLEPEPCWRVGQQLTRGRVIRLAREVLTDLAVEVTGPESRPTPVDVEAYPTRPGQMLLGAELPEADGCLALARLHSDARLLKNQPGETRSMGELRVQAFRDLLLGHAAPRELPVARPFDVQLTVDATGRAAAPRYGLLPPDAVDRILVASTQAGGRVRVKEVTARPCPGGHPAMAANPDPRYADDALATAIRMRDRTCRFPGCTIPAGRCDLDHSLRWPDGPTCECNLAALCRHHHRLKTHGRWRLINHGDGRLTWITPTGRSIASRPDP